ncbi:hepatocellular carcinoma-associated antigen 59-domain-containing protein [Zychaea mexicana]|uniref:hepatocellular carcinoma-associated antigen 59-domain-containing protein n=1 Tax=Zychaea mexicana TaxID=64656 RepID=UPI0022FF0BC7|nr:hepatocellular carcinoma-associated antigen 59-domain-containing protein [Zychaea mexicana]KAI9499311.1 hepatocellular carcinoma-associated antigen 59-domain-containing protein [Zychaea mexicana]
MPIQRKQRNYRKKKPESDDEEEQRREDSVSGSEDVSETIEDLQELRRLRRKHGGIDVDKLSKGDKKKKKKEPAKEPSDPWKLLTGGLVDKDAVRKGARPDDEEGTEKKLKLDTFTTQTNALDVDKHMMAYIEEEMRRRRGEAASKEEDEEDEQQQKDGLVDIYEELYMLPERLRVQSKHVEEGSVQLSTQMLTAIPEVDLGIDVRLKNIEETERAKRKYLDEHREEAGKSSRDEVPANFEKQLRKSDHRPRTDRRQIATDEIVAERFKKRMRK